MFIAAKSNLFQISFVCVLILWIGCRKEEFTLGEKNSQIIKELINKADTLYISQGRSPDFFSVPRDQLLTLVNAVDIVGFKEDFACLCDAEIVYYFYRGEELLMALGYHHDKSLRWQAADWDGDAVLSKASVDFMDRWLKQAFAVENKLPRGKYVPPALE